MSELRAVEVPQGLQKLLGGAQAVYFLETRKINDHGQSQRRYIVVTHQFFLNVKKSYLTGSYSIKRRVSVALVQGLVRDLDSGHFVVKMDPSVPGDYHYEGDTADQLIGVLLALKPQLKVWTLHGSVYPFLRVKYHKKSQFDIDDLDEDILRKGDSESTATLRE